MADLGVAVVVVNFRTAALVERCLDSIAACGGDGLDLEVVVLDNGSGDGSAERLRARADCRVVALEENRGFAAAVNAGVAATSGDPVVVLNSDTRVRPGALRALVDAVRADPAVGLAAPQLEHEDGTPQASAYRRLPTLATMASDVAIAPGYVISLLPGRRRGNGLSAEQLAAGEPYAWVMGAAFCVPRAWWRRIGGFEEAFFLYFEETDWQRRLIAAGGRVLLVRDARVEHLLRAGDPLMAVVSPHWVTSARRYFGLEGVAARRTAAVLRAALVVAWLTSWSTWARGDRAKAREMRRRIGALHGRAVGRARPRSAPEGPRRRAGAP